MSNYYLKVLLRFHGPQKFHGKSSFQNVLDDSANKKVPEDFPGTIGLVSDGNDKIILNPGYRITMTNL